MARSRAGSFLGVAVVGFWLGMMSWLLARELGYRRHALPPAALTAPHDSWLRLSLQNGTSVGFVHVRQEPETRANQPGQRLDLTTRLAFDLLGKRTDFDLQGTTWQGPARLEFRFAVQSAGHALEVGGTVEDRRLTGNIISGGETQPFDWPIQENLVFTSGLGSAVELPILEVGEKLEVSSFDPLTLRQSPWRLHCVAQEELPLDHTVILTRRLEVTASGLTTQVWIDDRGEVVRAETPVGLVLERTTREHALASRGQVGELLGQVAIVPRGKRPFRGAQQLEIVVAGPATLTLPQDDVQQSLGNGRYRLHAASPPWGVVPAATAAALAPHLAADAFIQAEHPKIQAQAAAIIGAERDPWQRALLLHDWVYTQLEKDVVLSLPSALEVLAQKRGDCNEHTVLFTALARAAGLPTRIAIGLVWSDELAGFYYHAWPEVHLGHWVGLDPTLGQPLADATHVKLLNGSLTSWPQLLPYLGKLQIEVVEVL